MEPTKNEKGRTSEDYPDLFRAFQETTGIHQTEYPKYWSPYKTPEEKIAYQKRLPSEIQPFVRDYFQRHRNELLSHQPENTGQYLNNTVSAWNRHLAVNRQIDCFLSYEYKNIFGDWSPEEWKLAKRLLIAGMETDHVKVMYSGGIKAKLDLEVEKLIKKYESVDPEFSSFLMTPSFQSFYISWELEHRKYMLETLKGNNVDVLKTELLERYHSGDEGVFKLRLNEIREKNKGKTPEQLEAEIQEIESRCKEGATKKIYNLIGRPDFQEFENLLRFDNTTEYEYTYSLKGLPDLFLREEILRRLVEKNKIEQDRSVFSLTISEFVVAIDEVIAKEESHFTIRLRHYSQNYDTCGTACIMSILNRKGLQLEEDVELRIWEMVGKPYNFPGGLAEVLLRNRFNVTYVQDKPEILDQNNPEFKIISNRLLAAAANYVDLFEQALERGLKFQVIDWDFDRVLFEIKRGNPCILYLHVTDTITHVVLAHGIKGNRIKIMDPLRSIKYLSREDLNSRIVNPMGKRLLVVHKLPHDFFTTLDEGLSVIGY
jgi:hypothetical protein